MTPLAEFIWKLSIAAAVAILAIVVLGVKAQVTVIEQRPVPLPCRTMQSLLKNRPTPAIHSYAKPIRVCEEQS